MKRLRLKGLKVIWPSSHGDQCSLPYLPQSWSMWSHNLCYNHIATPGMFILPLFPLISSQGCKLKAYGLSLAWDMFFSISTMFYFLLFYSYFLHLNVKIFRLGLPSTLSIFCLFFTHLPHSWPFYPRLHPPAWLKGTRVSRILFYSSQLLMAPYCSTESVCRHFPNHSSTIHLVSFHNNTVWTPLGA